MTTSQCAPVRGVPCTGRFHDLFEKRHDRWIMVLRQSIYEKDRPVPVDHTAIVELDPVLFGCFPVG